MTNRAEELKPLFELLERCHTVLADAFPHKGLKAIGGSRVFLRDPLVATLNKCVKSVIAELKESQIEKAVFDILALWVEVGKLLNRIERQDLTTKSDDEINKVATLLYLANGVTWNCVRSLTTEEPFHNSKYVRIEPLLPLLQRCAWENESNAGLQQIIQRLQTELKTCLR